MLGGHRGVSTAAPWCRTAPAQTHVSSVLPDSRLVCRGVSETLHSEQYAFQHKAGIRTEGGSERGLYIILMRVRKFGSSTKQTKKLI